MQQTRICYCILIWKSFLCFIIRAGEKGMRRQEGRVREKRGSRHIKTIKSFISSWFYLNHHPRYKNWHRNKDGRNPLTKYIHSYASFFSKQYICILIYIVELCFFLLCSVPYSIRIVTLIYTLIYFLSFDILNLKKKPSNKHTTHYQKNGQASQRTSMV